ncbi:hypothetical protein LAZ67_2005645 [Cordylochernes scorpioides]|uniref:Reverse transcriptase n=1 Tax=Cordylochernes scorpioides TaxID=51811 RepID=A0ABY6K4R6_9ARAC|nr:hypothetical protein LAZ67_2005645 [Cordylochernes scorpioides]
MERGKDKRGFLCQKSLPLSSNSFQKSLLHCSINDCLCSTLDSFFNPPPPDPAPFTFPPFPSHPPPNPPPDLPFTAVELSIALRNLRLKKSCGLDSLPGPFSKWLVHSFPNFFLGFFNSCFSAGHFPSLWKTGRLILLPKRSTSTDLIQKSRPIILLPILGKLLESLMAFRLTHHFESNNLIHPLQFGFRRRRSTIDALSLLHNKIKRAVSRHQCCLLISLDIKSAFDHLWHLALFGRLVAASCPPSLLQLYRSFLSNRTIHLSYRGFSRSTSPSRGCAQGYVSGPLLWNIFFNPLLSLSFPPGVHVQAFADDLQLLISGPPSRLPSLAQSSLDLIHTWCLDNKLSLSPHKSLVLPIFCNPPHLTIDNTPLTCPDTLTILGVTFDERLSFTPHLHRVCDKASSFLGRLSRWRFYCSVVEPAITYAAPIWCEAVKYRVGKASLRSLQRKFCVHAIRGFRTVPTLTAIALLRVLPLDPKVLLLSSLLRPPDPLPFTPLPLSFSPLPHYFPTSPSHFSPPPLPTSTTTRTAPSRGAALGPALPGSPLLPLSSCFPPLSLSIPLASHCSVFQAECFAFLSALSDLCSLPPSLSAAISSDCLSLLSALSSPHSPHPLVAQCQTLLYSLLPSRNLTLHWVKGHSGNLGNCQADTLAKCATVAPSLPPQYTLAPKTAHHKFLSRHFWSLWDEEFISAKPTFFLKLGLSPSSLSTSHSFLLPSSAIATGLLTGHTFIAAFPHRNTPPPFDPTCPHCNLAPETIDHVFFDCPNLDYLRATFFNKCLSDLGHIPTSLPQLFSSGKAWAHTIDFATHSNRFIPPNIPQSSSDSDT